MRKFKNNFVERSCDTFKDNPLEALREIFRCYDVECLKTELQYYQKFAVCHDSSEYDEPQRRKKMFQFCADFERVIFSMECFKEALKSEGKLPKVKRFKLLTASLSGIEQRSDLIICLCSIRKFCSSYSRKYSLREWQCVFEGGVIGVDNYCYSPLHALSPYVFSDLLVILKLCYLITKRYENV